MASEFWFYSQLHRLGYKAYITLGNTKSIDITVQLSDETLLTFDVKGKETFNSGTYQYLQKTKEKNHFFVFVGLQVEKENEKVIFSGEPECFIINSFDLDLFASNWESSKKTTKGYGLDQKILRTIKYYNSESGRMTKGEKRRLESFKRVKNYDSIDFDGLKKKILKLSDFEDKYFKKKLKLSAKLQI